MGTDNMCLFNFSLYPAPTSSTDRHSERGWGWCGTPLRQTSAPHFLQILILLSFSVLNPILVCLPHDLQTRATDEAETALSFETICPFWPCLRARRCFLIKFKPSTTTLLLLDRTWITLPVFPLSLPVIIITLSPLRNFIDQYNSNPQIYSNATNSSTNRHPQTASHK